MKHSVAFLNFISYQNVDNVFGTF